MTRPHNPGSGPETQRERAQSVAAAQLARADILLMLSELLLNPGTRHSLLTAASGASRDELLALAGIARSTPSDLRFPFVRGPRQLAVVLEELRDAIVSADSETWKLEHIRLFEGGVACPIREGAYVPGRKGARVAEVAAFYRAFGLEIAHGKGGDPDHLAAELEVAALLLVTHARALAAGGRASAQAIYDAFAKFSVQHLSDWLGPFCCRLIDVTDFAPLRILAEALWRAWVAICELNGLPRPAKGPAESAAAFGGVETRRAAAVA